MKNYYQLSAEETMKELNGSTEPLTDEQVREHKEKYGPRNSTRIFLLSSLSSRRSCPALLENLRARLSS